MPGPKKGARQMTLAGMRRLAYKKIGRAGFKAMNEVKVVICQDCDDPHPKVTTLLLTGDAFRERAFGGTEFLPGFLFSNKKQSNGELLFLTGVCKLDDESYWSPCSIQVCDGNSLSWNCLSGTNVYDAKYLARVNKK